jgi:hypothetical protein
MRGSGLVSTIDDLDTLEAAEREQILDELHRQKLPFQAK